MQPFFLQGSAGRLFAVYTPAADGCQHGHDVLVVPPFAEEMNRSRRMTSALARRLSAQGCGTLLLDLFGTGDSEGEFAQARLDIWLDDLGRGLDWLAARRAPAMAMVGLRMGALLALMLAARAPATLTRLVLWQPVLTGEQMLTQFLRVLAMNAGGTTAALRARLQAGETLDVAGYELSAGLATAIDELRLGNLPMPAGTALLWLDVVAQADRPLQAAAGRLAEQWRRECRSVDTRRVVGEPFWGMLEPPLVPGLVEQTARWMAGAPG